MSDFELGRKAGRLLAEQELFPLIDNFNEKVCKLTELLVAAKIERDTLQSENAMLKKQIESLAEQIDPDKQCPPDGPCSDDIACSACWIQWSRKKAESILK
jgi:hypothetical protein